MLKNQPQKYYICCSKERKEHCTESGVRLRLTRDLCVDKIG